MKELENQALILIDSLIGVISPNFRMISISKKKNEFKIKIILEKEIEEDIDEINELASDFEIRQSRDIDFSFETIISNSDIFLSGDEGIVVYRRREN